MGVFQRIGSGQFKGAVEGAQASLQLRERTPKDALTSGNSLSAPKFSCNLAWSLRVDISQGRHTN